MNEPSETPPAAAKRAGGRPILWIALAALLVLAAGAWWKLQSATTPGAAAAVAPPTVTVSQPLHKEIVEWDEYTGQFAAVDYVEVRARVGGYLDSVNFKDGQMVALGALVSIRDGSAPAAIERQDMWPMVPITANLAPGTTPVEARALCEKLAAEELPAGFRLRWLRELGGQE